MADDSGQEKSFEPTEQRKRQFREEGKVAKSQEITGAAGLLAGFGVLLVFAPTMAERLALLARQLWTVDTSADLTGTIAVAMEALVGLLAVPLAVMWLAAAVTGLVQGRAVIPKEPLKLDWERVNVFSNFQQKFLSPTPLVELAKGLLKIGLVGAAVWWGVKPRVSLLLALAHQEPLVMLTTLRSLAGVVLARAMPVAVAIAVLDYSYQHWRLKQKMMMSKEEVKRDAKNSEGDPQLKAARRRRQMEIARSVQSIKAVADADVIVVNPTHYTIALRYRRDEAPAPIVVAKGLDELALKMQAEARRHDIPRVENRPLARALYAKAKVGQVIPEDLYAAVAEVLAVIYRRKRGR